MVLKKICDVLLKEGEAVSHRSIPAHSGTHSALSVLRWVRRNPSVVVLPRLRFARYAVRSCSPSVPSLRWGLRSVTSGFTRYRLLASLRRSALLWLAIPKCPLRAAARQAHLTCAGVCTALFLLQTTPPHRPNTKKGGRSPVPLRVSNCYSSNPATTVSSVEESNAFAASVTGR